ncbi:MAG: hypothetical protein ACHQ8D_07725 [Candidatus Rokuibacteriota bacterium]|jgi:hypothetical protein
MTAGPPRLLATLGLLGLALIAASGVRAPGLADEPPTPNRASEYAAGERPWLQCGLEQALDVDFEGTGRPYRAEWRRCGPSQVERKPDRNAFDYPTHYVTVTRNAAAPAPLFVFDNVAEPSLTYIRSVQRMQFTGDGRQQLAVVTGFYGTGAAWDLCALGLINGTLSCWKVPDWRPAIASLLAPDEESWKSLLISAANDRLLVQALIYDTAQARSSSIYALAMVASISAESSASRPRRDPPEPRSCNNWRNGILYGTLQFDCCRRFSGRRPRKDSALMAISPRMFAVLQKVEAAREEHLAKLRERGKQEAKAKERAKILQMANLKKKPPLMKAAPPRATNATKKKG